MNNDININELRNPHHAACPDHWQDCNDARKFVEQLLDPAPITAEALAGLGFDVDAGCWQLKCASLDVVAYLDSCNKVFVNGRGVDGIKSLGQLTALLLALEGEDHATK